MGVAVAEEEMYHPLVLAEEELVVVINIMLLILKMQELYQLLLELEELKVDLIQE